MGRQFEIRDGEEKGERDRGRERDRNILYVAIAGIILSCANAGQIQDKNIKKALLQ